MQLKPGEWLAEYRAVERGLNVMGIQHDSWCSRRSLVLRQVGGESSRDELSFEGGSWEQEGEERSHEEGGTEVQAASRADPPS